jgi:hypothetical protein
MKCKNGGHWNRIEVEKLITVEPTFEPKAKYLIPMYLPLKEEKCSECGQVIAKEKELIRIVHNS